MTVYENIPHELQRLKQWCVCDSDKIPKTPATGQNASSIDPKTWGTFEEAVDLVRYGRFESLGLILSETDPYVFIDLDNKPSNPVPADVWEEQIGWMRACPSAYIEESTSGSGLHMFVRGAVPSGRKTDHTEIYSRARFAIFTGASIGTTCGEKEIPYAQDLVERILAYLPEYATADAEDLNVDLSEPELCSDDDIVRRIANAENREKFSRLIRGDTTVFPPDSNNAPDWSRMDMSFMQMLTIYTRNVDQMIRVWRSARGLSERHSELDIRRQNKHRGKDKHILTTVRKALLIWRKEERARLISSEHIKVNMQRFRVAEAKKSVKQDLPVPPGWTGFMYQHFLARDFHDHPAGAIAGTIALLSALVGNSCVSPTNCGLNLYLLLIGETGTGKDEFRTHITGLLHAASVHQANIESILGAEQFASGQGLRTEFTAERPSILSIVGEIGGMLRRFNDAKDQHALTTKTTMLTLYNTAKRDAVLGATAYSDKDKKLAKVERPFFSLLGETTPGGFNSVVNAEAILDGFFPRFIAVRNTFERLNPDAIHKVRPEWDERLVRHVSELFGMSTMLRQQGRVCKIAWADETQTLYDQVFREDVEKRNESLASGNDSVEAALRARCIENSIRVASVMAFADSPAYPVVQVEHLDWAIQFVQRGLGIMIDPIKLGETNEKSITGQMAAICSAVRKTLRLDHKGRKGNVELLVAANAVTRSEITVKLPTSIRNNWGSQGLSGLLREAVAGGYLIKLLPDSRGEVCGGTAECYAPGNAFLLE